MSTGLKDLQVSRTVFLSSFNGVSVRFKIRDIEQPVITDRPFLRWDIEPRFVRIKDSHTLILSCDGLSLQTMLMGRAEGRGKTGEQAPTLPISIYR